MKTDRCFEAKYQKIVMVMSMESFDNLQFESEVYFKLQTAEKESELTTTRYSSKEVLKAIKDAIGGEQFV